MDGSPATRPTAADRVLDVALAQIAQHGMSVGLEGIRMEDAIASSGVSRATAYRRWPTRDDFMADVLVATVRRTTLIPETQADIRRLTDLIAADAARLDDPAVRRDVVVEALRVSVDADVRRLLASPQMRTFLSLSASYPSLPQGRVSQAVGSALAETNVGFAARRRAVYERLADMVGYRLTAGASYDELSGAAGSLMTGIVVRATSDPDWLDRRQDQVRFGATRAAAWSEPEVQLVRLVLTHLEPDPAGAWTPEAVAERLARFDAVVAELLAQPTSPV